MQQQHHAIRQPVAMPHDLGIMDDVADPHDLDVSDQPLAGLDRALDMARLGREHTPPHRPVDGAARRDHRQPLGRGAADMLGLEEPAVEYRPGGAECHRRLDRVHVVHMRREHERACDIAQSPGTADLRQGAGGPRFECGIERRDVRQRPQFDQHRREPGPRGERRAAGLVPRIASQQPRHLVGVERARRAAIERTVPGDRQFGRILPVQAEQAQPPAAQRKCDRGLDHRLMNAAREHIDEIGHAKSGRRESGLTGPRSGPSCRTCGA